MVSVSRMVGLPDAVAGVMQYRGVSIPVVDLSQLTAGFPAPARMNTRVVLVTARTADGQTQIYGLIAERATRMISLTQEQFTVVSEDGYDLPFLGKVAWESGIAMRQMRVLEQIEGEVVELIEGVGFGGKFERSVLRFGLHAQSSLAGEP